MKTVHLRDVMDHGKRSDWRWQINITLEPDGMACLFGYKKEDLSYVSKEGVEWFEMETFDNESSMSNWLHTQLQQADYRKQIKILTEPQKGYNDK